MSNWPGKFVIGLTGNIATGKSVVRRMLEHLGAYGIDADALSHRAIARGAPGHKPVVDTFGKFILDTQGEIDRGKLGRLVFSDPEALKQLEKIVHPLVEQAVDVMIRRSNQKVIVIEAIKILESNLASVCDTIWTTHATEETQKKRLMTKRGMSADDAIRRIRSQPSQEEKIAIAKRIIQNDGSFEQTWQQVVEAWKSISQGADTPAPTSKITGSGELSAVRSHPRDSAIIAELITHLSGGRNIKNAEDIMADFGDKAFLILKADGRPIGMVGWQVENLVARLTDIYLDPSAPLPGSIQLLITEVEKASRDLQCEAALLFIPPDLMDQNSVWKDLGYETRSPQALGVQAWQDAAVESMPPGTHLLFKQLRQDRILRPI